MMQKKSINLLKKMMEAKDKKLFEDSYNQLINSTNPAFMVYFEKFLNGT